MSTISRDAFEGELREALEAAGLTREEFIELGRAGALEDENLQGLWLIAGPVLLDE